jgi:hypothetical protein
MLVANLAVCTMVYAMTRQLFGPVVFALGNLGVLLYVWQEG